MILLSGISPSSSIRAFQPFFVTFELPYSIKRGEEVEFPLTVHSYLNECFEVMKDVNGICNVSRDKDDILLYQ